MVLFSVLPQPSCLATFYHRCQRRCVRLAPSSGPQFEVSEYALTDDQCWQLFPSLEDGVRSKVMFELHASPNQYVVLRPTGMGLVAYKGLGERSLNYKEHGLLHTRLSLW